MAPCSDVAGAVASMLCALGFAGVFCAPPSAGFCAEPIVVTQGAFAREARLADGGERGRVDVGVLVCREEAGAAEAVCLAAERALRGGGVADRRRRGEDRLGGLRRLRSARARRVRAVAVGVHLDLHGGEACWVRAWTRAR